MFYRTLITGTTRAMLPLTARGKLVPLNQTFVIRTSHIHVGNGTWKQTKQVIYQIITLSIIINQTTTSEFKIMKNINGIAPKCEVN